MNFPNGSRAYVDNQTTFILGEGSNLTIGKVENTAGIIGVEGNGKLKINEYKGTDLYNHDNLTTTGGSIGVDFGKGGAKVNGVGVNNESHRKEGITRHTVIGNVEIGSTTGSPINRDRSKANETTRDDHSSTNVYIEGQTIDYATNPSKLKEDIGKAKDEIKDIGRAIKESLNDRGDDNRNFLGQLSEGRLQRTIENIGGERLRKSTTQEDISKTLKDTYKDLGYDVNIIFTTPDKAPQLIDEKGNIKAGTAYVGKDGKHTIKINTEAKENQDRAGLIGTITEEGSHVIGKVEGRQRKVPEGSEEKGLESTGRATNDFFNKTYEEGNIPIQTKPDGKDYSKADFGEHVGDFLGNIERLENTVYYKYAQTTLKERANEDINKLAKMYNITEKDGAEILRENKALAKDLDFIEGSLVGVAASYATDGLGKLLSGGHKVLKFVITSVSGGVFDNAYQNSKEIKEPEIGDELKKKNILIGVAYIEKTRKEVSDFRFSEDKYLFKNIKNKSNLTMRDVGIVNSSLSNGSHMIKDVSESKERIKLYKEYEKTKNPDVYFKPRSLKLKVPNLRIQYTDIEEITSH
ncbi:hypothetical protein [Pseudoleptotrichia goodfellowii]|uniref:Hemolysin n=1 Tax=Pseudoleptotrichia goodfellowii TaxID=157692 RepID=A0A510JD63_9FUSO|nr:hypothetical protein [Pseudoleptotrichia goodfellowii]BBM37147.1 hypothetical protein JCM16774_2106 [Pseudoleptotrichia goodfellowii]